MTTSITVNAHAGWPVKVTKQLMKDGKWEENSGEIIVAPMTTQQVSIWDGHRVIVEEMRKET